jgi:hypothetical protein
LDEKGNFVRFKVHLVLQGYRQRFGFDYFLTASPVTKMNAVRMILFLAASHDLECHAMDVSTAYLNADMKDTVFMKIPKGMRLSSTDTQYLQVIKALYGAKQSGRRWYEHLTEFLLKNGYKQTKSDPCVVILRTHTNLHLYVCIYVDDLLIVGDPAAVTSFKRLLLSEFTMTDFGDAKQFLGFEIHRNRIGKRLLLTQTQYTKDLLERYTFPSLWPNPIPANPKRDLSI